MLLLLFIIVCCCLMLLLCVGVGVCCGVCGLCLLLCVGVVRCGVLLFGVDVCLLVHCMFVLFGVFGWWCSLRVVGVCWCCWCVFL